MPTCAGIPPCARARACHARRRPRISRRLRSRPLRVVRFSSLPLSHPALIQSYVLFTRKADVRPLTWGYKFLREIARRMPHFRGEPPALHPAFAPGEPASVVALAEGPVPFDAPRIVYSEEDERAIEEFVGAKGK